MAILGVDEVGFQVPHVGFLDPSVEAYSTLDNMALLNSTSFPVAHRTTLEIYWTAYLAQIWQKTVAPVQSSDTFLYKFIIQNTVVVPPKHFLISSASIELLNPIPPNVNREFGVHGVIYWGRYAWVFQGPNKLPQFGDMKFLNFQNMSVDTPPRGASGIYILPKPGCKCNVELFGIPVSKILYNTGGGYVPFDPARGDV